MNYTESLHFIQETKKYGIVPGLGNIRNLMEELGNVQDTLSVVHIAGTNGKGSVGTFLWSMLRQAGYHVGRFSSPEVFCYEEIFWYDDAPADQAELAAAFTEVKAACDRLVEAGKPHPTKFEVETAAAFVLFAGKKCGVVLMEVGMGGAEDATNVIKKPVLSVLTSISMDHMQYLGDTVEQIAQIKAGIIKPGCPVVAVRRRDAAYDGICQVIARTCRETGSELCWADAGEAKQVQIEQGMLSFCYHIHGTKQENEDRNVRLGMIGACQVENAVCAIEAAALLESTYSRLTAERIFAGLETAIWKGRFSRLGSMPDFYMDGAHNPDAAKKLKETLDLAFPGEKLICIMGVLADKAVDQIVEEMLPKARMFLTVTPDNPRAMQGEALAELIGRKGGHAVYMPQIRDAVWRGIDEAKKSDSRVLAFGSLSYLKEIEQEYNSRKEDYVNLVLHHPLFADTMFQMKELERDRIYCCHQLGHLLDVARIAWILYLEDQRKQSTEVGAVFGDGDAEQWKKTDIYVCALLHDIGRVKQYRSGVSHVGAGVAMAEQILADISYPVSRRSEILRAIGMHQKKDEVINGTERSLSCYIVRADHMSRNCFACKATDTCKWKEEKRNYYIEI